MSGARLPHKGYVFAMLAGADPLVPLFLLQLSHSLGRTFGYGAIQVLRLGLDSQKTSNLSQLSQCVCFEIFITNKQEIRTLPASVKPTCNIFRPGSPIRRDEPSSNEIANKLLNRVIILYEAVFAVKLEIRKRHVPRIANHIQNLGIARIEVLMTLQNARPRNPLQCSARECRCIR